MERHAAVYILANKRNGTLYTGAISNLTQRIWQHRHGEVSGFASKYNVDRLVWYDLNEEVCRYRMFRKSVRGFPKGTCAKSLKMKHFADAR